jgi:hypothetical protein
VDASGEILGSDDVDGRFDGVVELSARLAGSAQVRSCVTAQWLSYATGVPQDHVRCLARKFASDFDGSGTDLRKLVASIVKSEAFSHRMVSPQEVCQ